MEGGANTCIVEPHLNANAYKYLEESNIKQKYSDFIQLHEDDSVLLGFSCMTSRIWDGGAIITNGIENMKEAIVSKKKNPVSISLQTGAPCGTFLDSSKRVLLGEDSGAMSMWNMSETSACWSSLWGKELESDVHDGPVLAVECLELMKTYITGSMDMTIKVFDIEDFLVKTTYPYRESSINDLSVGIKSNSVFASANADGSVSLWDVNCQSKVSHVRMLSETRCVQFVDEWQLAAADEAGGVRLLDLRRAATPLACARLPHPAHRLRFQQSTNRLAVCGESALVTVYSADSLDKLCSIQAERDCFVRDLAWDLHETNTLHMVTWDGPIYSRSVYSA